MVLLPADGFEFDEFSEIVDEMEDYSYEYCGDPFVDVDESVEFVIEDGILKKYCGKSLTPVVPEGVVAIEGGAFMNKPITKVTLPSTLKELRSYNALDSSSPYYLWFYFPGYWLGPFYRCEQLKEVYLPEGLKVISEGAFHDCISLESIKIPNTVTKIKCYAFANCKSLTTITIPEYVTSIDTGTFQGCENLTSVVIENDFAKIGIGENAFLDCTRLTSIDVSDTEILKSRCPFEGTPILNKKIAEMTALEEQRAVEERKKENLCQHCGGDFTDSSSPKCIDCGKLKDY